MIFLILLLTLCSTMAICLWIALWRLRFTHFPCPGGPWFRWGPCGHVFFVKKLRAKYPELNFFDINEKVLREMGTDVMIYFFFHIQVILVMNLDAVKTILSDHRHFTKAVDTVKKTKSIFGQRTFGANNVLFEIGTDIWSKKRKILDPAFSKKFLRSIFEDLNLITDELVTYLDERAGKEIDVLPVLNRAALEVVFHCGFGLKRDSINDEDCLLASAVDAMTEAVEVCFRYRFTYLLPWNFTELKTRYKRDMPLARELLRQQAENRMTNQDGLLHNNDILSHIIAANADFTMDDLVDDFTVFMAAGMETTTNTVSYVLWYLLKYPSVYSRVQEEVDALGQAEYEDVSNGLVYLEQVIKETMRLSSTVNSTSREPVKDIMVEGYLFRKGVTIMIPQCLIQRSELHWPDPLVFDPERFRPGSKIVPFTYMPFMAGPRACIGRHFAMLEMKLMLMRLIRKFELVDPHPEERELKTEIAMTMKPANGMPIILLRRE